MSDRQRHGFVLLIVAGLDRRLGGGPVHPADGPGARSQGRRAARLPGRALGSEQGDRRIAAARGRHHALARRSARRRRARDPGLRRQRDLRRVA